MCLCVGAERVGGGGRWEREKERKLCDICDMDQTLYPSTKKGFHATFQNI